MGWFMPRQRQRCQITASSVQILAASSPDHVPPDPPYSFLYGGVPLFTMVYAVTAASARKKIVMLLP
jgi:hypothetical protein